MNLIVNDLISIQHLETDKKGEFIAVVNESGNKITVYSSNDYKCVFKFWRGQKTANIIKICFDNENQFMALISTQMTIHFFKLNRLRNHAIEEVKNTLESNLNCPCNYSEEEINNERYYNFNKTMLENTNHISKYEKEENKENIFKMIYNDFIVSFRNYFNFL